MNNRELTEAENIKAAVNDEDDNVFELIALWEVWEDFISKVGREYQFVPDPEGRFSGFSVYYLCKKLEIKGLQTPESFSYWRKLTHNDKQEYSKFYNKASIVLAAMGSNASKEARNKLTAIFNSLLGRINDNRSELFSQAMARISADATVRTLDGSPECHKVVPMVSWFSPQVQALDPLAMLSIFPEAEAKILMLILGKALVGYNGAVTREGVVDHTARAYGIMVDQVGGLGKSTIMNYVRETMAKLGFSVVAVNINMSRFGWGSIAKSDLALIDDLENEKLKAIITSAQIKSLTTNGTIRVEEKGIAACEMRSLTTVLGASNTTDPRHFFEMDGGSMSRLNQLQCHSPSYLTDKFGTFRQGAIKEHWDSLTASIDGCNIETLTSYLLARSAEYFMSEVGLSVVDGNLTKGEDRLMETMEALREQLRICPNMTYTDDFLKSLGKFQAYKLRRKSTEEAKLELRNLKLSPKLLIAYIEFYGSDEVEDNIKNAIIPTTLDRESLRYAHKKLSEFKQQENTCSYSRSFENIISQLSSDRGFGYPRSLSFYDPKWELALDGAYGEYLKFANKSA